MLEQLAGDPQRQVQILTRPVLNDLKEVAKTALLWVPDCNKPDLDFSKVKQGPDEPYIKFLDCLKLTLDKQVAYLKKIRRHKKSY